MRLLEKRPLAAWCFTFVACSFLLFFLSTTVKWLIALLLVSLLLTLLFETQRFLRIYLCGLLLAGLLAVATSLLTYDYGYFSLLSKWEGKQVRIRGEVQEVAWESEDTDRLTIRLYGIDGEAVSALAQVSVAKHALTENELFSATITLRSSASGYTSFGSRWYALSQDILFAGEATEITATTEGTPTKPSALSTLRGTISSVLENTIGGKESALVKGLLLGERSALDASVKRDFQRCGTSHLLAVSGLHLSILLGILAYCNHYVFSNRYLRFLLLLFFVVFFALLVGLRASILRAGAMAVLTACAELFGRRSDSVTNLAVAAAGILLFSPTAILDLGYLLSCLATFGILVLGLPLIKHLQEALKRRVPGHRRLCGLLLFLPTSLILTTTATVFTLPICAICFDSFSLLTPLANLVLVPLATLLISLAIPALLCGFLSPSIPVFAWATRTVASVLLQGAAWGSTRTGITIAYAIPYLVPIICTGVLLILLALLCLRRIRFACLALCLLILASAIPVTVFHVAATGGTSVSYFPSSTSDVLLTTNGKNNALIIGGECTEACLSKAFSDIRSICHVDELSTLVLLHPSDSTLSLLSWYLKSVYVAQLVLVSPSSFSAALSLQAKLSVIGTAVHLLSTTSNTTCALTDLTIHLSTEQEVVLETYGQKLFYQRGNTLRRTAFYEAHLSSLSAILLSGQAQDVDCGDYLPPIVGLRSSMRFRTDKDISFFRQGCCLIRLTKNNCLFYV